MRERPPGIPKSPSRANVPLSASTSLGGESSGELVRPIMLPYEVRGPFPAGSSDTSHSPCFANSALKALHCVMCALHASMQAERLLLTGHHACPAMLLHSVWVEHSGSTVLLLLLTAGHLLACT